MLVQKTRKLSGIDEGGDRDHLAQLQSYVNGLASEAIEFHEQALVIRREISDRSGEGVDTLNIGIAFLALEEFQNAMGKLYQSIQIGSEISSPQMQLESHWGMAQAYLFQNDLVNARTAIEAALGYDVPQNNHNASALHGIILLRMRDASAGSAQRLTGLTESRPDGKGSDEDLSGLAVQAFLRAIGQADEILSKTAEYYSALDAKGLALVGAGLVRAGLHDKTDNLSGTDTLQDKTNVSKERSAPTGDPARTPEFEQAIECFRKARKIAPHTGVVKSVLRLFDELAKCDKDGVLKGIREVIEGK